MRLGFPHSKGGQTALAGVAGAVLVALALTPGERIAAGLSQPLSLDTLLDARSPGGRESGNLALTKVKRAALADTGAPAGPPGARQRVLPMLRDRGDGPIGAGPPQQAAGFPDLGLVPVGLGPLLQGPVIGDEPIVGGPGDFFPGFPGFGPPIGPGGGGPLVPVDTDDPDDTDNPDGPSVPGDPNAPGTPAPPPAPVPEPGTWAMLLAGVGVIGGVLRRKRKHGTTRFPQKG